MTDMPARRVDLRSGTVALPADEMHQAMSEYNLNLFEDRLEARDETRWPLAEGYRIIYLVGGGNRHRCGWQEQHTRRKQRLVWDWCLCCKGCG